VWLESGSPGRSLRGRKRSVVDPLDWTLFKPLRGGLRGPVEFERAGRRAKTKV
jgi:hypothetical protein